METRITGSAKKAGILLHGTDKNGHEQWLMGYSEGRFAFDGEYFMPVKGKVEEGQDELDAALRELGEETGLWLADGLSEEHMQKLRRGEDLKNIRLPNHPGVTIKRFHAKPHRTSYRGRAGYEHSLAMFEVEIDGIENLKTLKNSEGITTKHYLAEHPHLPDFRTRLQWLLAGQIEGSNAALIDAEWFKGLLRHHAPLLLHPDQLHGAALRNMWKEFNSKIEQEQPEQYIKLRRAYEAIKEHAKRQQWVGDDGDIIKLDLNDSPLYWCVEGARFVMPRDALAKMFHDMATNPDYNEAVGGLAGVLGRLDPVNRVLASQLAGVVWRATPAQIEGGLDAAIAVNGGKPLSWMKAPEVKPGTQIITPSIFAQQLSQLGSNERAA